MTDWLFWALLLAHAPIGFALWLALGPRRHLKAPGQSAALTAAMRDQEVATQRFLAEMAAWKPSQSDYRQAMEPPKQ